MIGYLVIIIVCIILIIITVHRVSPSLIREVQPKQILVVTDMSGRKFYKDGKVFIFPFLQKDHILSLEPIEFDLKIQDLQNGEGAFFEALMNLRIRIGETDSDIEKAAERFIDKTHEMLAEFLEGIISRNFTIFLQEYDLKDLSYDTSSLFINVETSLKEDLNKIGIAVDYFKIKSFCNQNGPMNR